MSLHSVALVLGQLIAGADREGDFRIQSDVFGKIFLKSTFGDVVLLAAVPDSQSGADLGPSSAYITEETLRQRMNQVAPAVSTINSWIADSKFRVRKIFAVEGERQHQLWLLQRAGGSEKESVIELTITAAFTAENAAHEMGHAVLRPYEQDPRSKMMRALSCIFVKLGQTKITDFTVNGQAKSRALGYLMFDPVRWAPEANRTEHQQDEISELWASALEAYIVAPARLTASIAQAKLEDPHVSPSGDDLIAILQALDPKRGGSAANLTSILETVLARPGCAGSPPSTTAPSTLNLGSDALPSAYGYLVNPASLMRDGGKKLSTF